jgi:hypothetical protein
VPAGPTNGRLPCTSSSFSGLLSDEDNADGSRSFSEYCLRGGQIEVASVAAPGGFANHMEAPLLRNERLGANEKETLARLLAQQSTNHELAALFTAGQVGNNRLGPGV